MSKIVISIVNKQNRLLLVRRKYQEGDLHWQFPGGSQEESESEKDTAQREVFEETHVLCNPLFRIGERIHPSTKKEIVYWACEYISEEPIDTLDEDIDLIQWMTPDELRQAITSNIYEKVSDYISQLE